MVSKVTTTDLRIKFGIAAEGVPLREDELRIPAAELARRAV